MNDRSPSSAVRRRFIGTLHLFLAVVIPMAVLCLTTSSYCDVTLASPKAPIVMDKGGLYDIEASATDIKLVIDALARSSNANIIISPEITGDVTAHLKQMPLESLLSHLASSLNFNWRKDGDAYLLTGKEKPTVPSTEKVEQIIPATTVAVWQCKHVKPADAAASLQTLFPKLKVVEGPGAITPTLGASGSGYGAQPSSDTGQSPGISSSVTESRGNSIILMGAADEIDRAKQVLLQVDVKRPQVLIKVSITEVNNSAKDDVGVSWAFSDLVVKENAPASGIKFGTFTRTGMSFDGVISALIDHGKAKLLAQPNISVVDGEKASILIGDRILFPKLVGYNQNGAAIYDKAEERVGIYLQICARVTDGDEVVMNVYPQVSLVTGFLKTQAGDYPQISTREAQTTVAVKNMQTLAIGGLLRDDEIKDVTKVPLLGDLPIIGQFFRHTKTTKQQNEILILLTPTILE